MKYQVSLITAQKIVYVGNFQHGETYLSPSYFTVSNYSTNKYGSEIISETFNVISLLQKCDIKLQNEWSNEYSALFDFVKNPSEPVIYKIKDLPFEYLSKGESGEELYQQINEVNLAITKYGYGKYEPHVQQLNFRVGKPIPWKLIIE